MKSKFPEGSHCIIHRSCGAIAFVYGTEPIKCTRILRDLTYNLDGSKFATDQPLSRCGSCGGVLAGAYDLRPGGPLLRTFDMDSTEDMREFYSHVNDEEAVT